ncbi:MAG: hypothetical protein Q4C48_01165 [Lachnospiraceae bacterium]|nr:hypothetical protein [Lachnospiraceae bacterium]
MKQIYEKMKEIGLGKLLLLLAAGIALLVLSFPGDRSSDNGGGTAAVPTLALSRQESVGNEYYEQRFQEMLEATKGLGVCKVMLSPDMDGVLVVTEGAADAEAVLEITYAAEVIFGIPAHKVKVLPYN